MDPLDIKAAVEELPKIGADLIDHAEQDLDAEMVKAQQMVGEERNVTAGVLSNLINQLLIGIQSAMGTTTSDLKRIIVGLDGWTLEYGGTIRLTKPKEDTNA